jgi:hypothetical protein
VFIYLCVLTFPLLDCSEFGNFVITLTYLFVEAHIMDDDDTALDGGADVGPGRW